MAKEDPPTELLPDPPHKRMKPTASASEDTECSEFDFARPIKKTK